MRQLSALNRIVYAALCTLLLLVVSAKASHRYLGCYADKNIRDLAYHWADPALTVTKCLAKCKSLNYAYFGLQAAAHCFCGNSYGLYGKATGKCTRPCGGNTRQMCGNDWINSVYSTGIVHKKPFKYIGCYADKARRDLALYVKLSKLTPRKCYEACKARGYAYFGLQAGAYCFCGNSYGLYGVRPRRECNLPCLGDHGDHCGAPWRNSLYSTGLKGRREFKYIGCYTDKPKRDLAYFGFRGTLTIKRCFVKCKSLNYAYFGLQAADHCFCGNSYGMYGKAEGKCIRRCSGDNNHICGSNWISSVYSTGIVHKKPFKYIGCYADKARRDLALYVKLAKLTPRKCYDACKAIGYAYFGLQAGAYCFCGNSYGLYGVRPRRECNLPCLGDHGDHCGAPWRNSLYSTGLKVPKRSYKYIGCFQDKLVRDLSHPVKTSGPMSPAACYKACSSLGYPYFATQSGSLCFCGDSYGGYRRMPVTECNAICKGDRAEYCGGEMRNSVYTILNIQQNSFVKTTCIDPYDGSDHELGSKWQTKDAHLAFCYKYKCTNGAEELEPVSTKCLDRDGKCVTASAAGARFKCKDTSSGAACKCLLDGGSRVYWLPVM